ncbi:hypothetical protein AMTRI_Chr02g264170 [Amborella trichopoda]
MYVRSHQRLSLSVFYFNYYYFWLRRLTASSRLCVLYAETETETQTHTLLLLCAFVFYLLGTKPFTPLLSHYYCLRITLSLSRRPLPITLSPLSRLPLSLSKDDALLLRPRFPLSLSYLSYCVSLSLSAPAEFLILNQSLFSFFYLVCVSKLSPFWCIPVSLFLFFFWFLGFLLIRVFIVCF